MLFTVTIDLNTTQPLTIDTIDAVAAIGGAASARPGDHLIGTTLTIDAPDAVAAGQAATDTVTSITPGHPIALEVLTIDEFDRRNPSPEPVGT